MCVACDVCIRVYLQYCSYVYKVDIRTYNTSSYLWYTYILICFCLIDAVCWWSFIVIFVFIEATRKLIWYGIWFKTSKQNWKSSHKHWTTIFLHKLYQILLKFRIKSLNCQCSTLMMEINITCDSNWPTRALWFTIWETFLFLFTFFYILTFVTQVFFDKSFPCI